MGLFTHGTTEVDFIAKRETLQVADRFRLKCAVALDRLGEPALSPNRSAREIA